MRYSNSELDMVNEKLSLLKGYSADLQYRVDVKRIFNTQTAAGLSYAVSRPGVRLSFALALSCLVMWTAVNVIFVPANIGFYPTLGKKLIYTSISEDRVKRNNGLLISNGSLITVAKGNYTIFKLPDNSDLILQGPAILSVKANFKNRFTGSSTYSFYLKSGKVIALLHPSSHKRRMIVNTKHARMEAKGTIFSVGVGEKSTSLSVYAGSVFVLNKDLRHYRSEIIPSERRVYISDTGMRIAPIPKAESSMMAREAEMLSDPSIIQKDFTVKTTEEHKKKGLDKYFPRVEYWIENE